jgi:hypothetical protein
MKTLSFRLFWWFLCCSGDNVSENVSFVFQHLEILSTGLLRCSKGEEVA